MALEGIQGICLSIPHEGGINKHRGYFPAREIPIAILRHESWHSINYVIAGICIASPICGRGKLLQRELVTNC